MELLTLKVRAPVPVMVNDCAEVLALPMLV